MDVTAKRIVWGKFANAVSFPYKNNVTDNKINFLNKIIKGQTCVAPDYILCTKEVQVSSN